MTRAKLNAFNQAQFAYIDRKYITIMRKILILLWGLIPFMALSQDLPTNPETGKVEYTSTIEVNGTKEELFSKAKGWVMHTFSSAEEMIQTADPAQGFLEIKGISLIDYTALNADSVVEVPMHFTLAIDLQDNQYRYRFTDIYFTVGAGDTTRNIPMEETLLGKAEKRMILSEHVNAAGLELTTEQFQEELKATYHQYDKFQSKGSGTLVGISNLLKDGMQVAPE